MKLEFKSKAIEQLMSAYYDDFFFQDVEVIEEETKQILLKSDFQGKFLQSIWDVLIEFDTNETDFDVTVKRFGHEAPYTLSKKGANMHILAEGSEVYSYEIADFFKAFYDATKYYLHYIRRENPRVVFKESYQQLSASIYYYETHKSELPIEF